MEEVCELVINYLKNWLKKNFFKILNKIKKKKKKNISQILRFKLYEQLMKQDEEVDKQHYVRYVYINQPREYIFNTSQKIQDEEKSIWEIKQIGEIFPPNKDISYTYISSNRKSLQN